VKRGSKFSYPLPHLSLVHPYNNFCTHPQNFSNIHNEISSSQVTANDADVDRPNNIIYFLTGPGINAENPSESNFDINKATGEIFVLKVS